MNEGDPLSHWDKLAEELGLAAKSPPQSNETLDEHIPTSDTAPHSASTAIEASAKDNYSPDQNDSSLVGDSKGSEHHNIEHHKEIEIVAESPKKDRLQKSAETTLRGSKSPSSGNLKMKGYQPESLEDDFSGAAYGSVPKNEPEESSFGSDIFDPLEDSLIKANQEDLYHPAGEEEISNSNKTIFDDTDGEDVAEELGLAQPRKILTTDIGTETTSVELSDSASESKEKESEGDANLSGQESKSSASKGKRRRNRRKNRRPRQTETEAENQINDSGDSAVSAGAKEEATTNSWGRDPVSEKGKDRFAEHALDDEEDSQSDMIDAEVSDDPESIDSIVPAPAVDVAIEADVKQAKPEWKVISWVELVSGLYRPS